MVMANDADQKKFEARASRDLLEQLEAWCQARPSPINNSQVLTGMIRLFLAAPEGLRLRAMFGQLAIEDFREPSCPFVGEQSPKALVDASAAHWQEEASKKAGAEGKRRAK